MEQIPEEKFTPDEILKLPVTINFPPFQGWNSTGTKHEYQHSPTIQIEGMTFDEPLDKDNCVVLNGTKFRVVWEDKSGEANEDGSSKTIGHLELAE